MNGWEHFFKSPSLFKRKGYFGNMFWEMNSKNKKGFLQANGVNRVETLGNWGVDCSSGPQY